MASKVTLRHLIIQVKIKKLKGIGKATLEIIDAVMNGKTIKDIALGFPVNLIDLASLRSIGLRRQNYYTNI